MTSVPQNYKYEEHKDQIPLSSITMRKTKKYIYDVKNKIVELHKIESGCKKRVKTLKIPISTIRVIIKRFQSTKDVKNLPEEDVCLYRPNARWGGEFE